MIKAKSTLNFFDKLVLFFNYISALALLVGYLAPYISPQTFWPVAFFGIAYPIVLPLNVFFIIYWFFRSKKRMLISFVCIIVGYSVFFKHFGFHTPTNDGPKQKTNYTRVMNYNVHGFGSFTFGSSVSTEHDIFKIVDEQQPDVMCFEEFSTHKTGKYAICDSLQQILHTNQYHFEAFSAGDNQLAGLAIFSKYRVVNRGIIRFSQLDDDNQCIYADLIINKKTCRVYCVHLQSIKFEQQDYKYLNGVTNDDKSNVSYTKHIISKLKLAFIKRAEQVMLVKQNIAKCPYPYIICGDFNDTPSSFAVNEMDKGIKNTFVEKGFGLGRTYNGDFPNFQIDYIMATNQFDVVNYEIIEKRLSDHYTVRSDLLLK